MYTEFAHFFLCHVIFGRHGTRNYSPRSPMVRIHTCCTNIYNTYRLIVGSSTIISTFLPVVCYKIFLVCNHESLIGSSEVVWFLDFIQTLPMEVVAVWSSKVSGAAVIFLLNRYVFGVSIVLTLAGTMPGMTTNSR